MSKLSTYMFFNGNCAEAFRFYERALGGTIALSMTYKEAPPGQGPPAGPEVADKIMHVSLQVGGDVLMGADWCLADPPYPGCEGFSVHLALENVARAEQVFGALSDGGSVHMPLGKTFWAERFGMVTDRFNIDWMISVDAA